MTRCFLLAVAVAVLLGASPAHGQEQLLSPLIVTTGRATGSVPPTAAELSLGVESRSSSAGAAAADNGARQRKLLAVLGRLGYGVKDARLTRYTLRADTDYESGKVRHYEASTEVEVAVRDLATLGTVIDSALAAGATEITYIRFVADSLAVLRARLLAEALELARRDAASLAEAAGGNLGELVEMSTIPFLQGPDGSLHLASGSVRPSGFTTIGPSDVTLDLTLYTRWRLAK